jgi:hypothetical protein
MMLDIFDFYDKMDKNNILLSFKGDITSELLTSILQIMENKMDNMQEEPKTKKKVYNVLLNVFKIYIITWMMQPILMAIKTEVLFL